MKVKRSEERQVMEEVFDKLTLMTLYHLMHTGHLKKLHGVVKSGKEARIYRGIEPSGQEVAVKIYLTTSAEFKKGMITYIEGDKRFLNVKRDTRSLVYTWALKEFKNLKKASEVGVRVPKPLTVEKNILVMEFIGRGGVSAPLLREVEVENPGKIYRELLGYVETLYVKGDLVHGDLSEFNVMILDGTPFIFDMSQSVLTTHPQAKFLLERDLANLNRYFKKLGVKVRPVEGLYEKIVKPPPQ